MISVLAAATFLLVPPALPDTVLSRREALEYDGAAGEIRVATPRLEDVDVLIDGRIEEAAWGSAALLNGFTQFDPSEGIPATQPTEVRVFVTDEAIYFAIKAFDSEPEGIRATMAERDNMTRSNDYVRVILDTFNDQRRAYVFSVNPFGVQQDGIWLVGGGGRGRRRFGPPIDDNPDFIWDSGARLTDYGYGVEIRIPLKSLRFAEVPVQSWGVQVTRRIQRNGYQQSWAPSFASQPNKLLEAGALLELEDLDPGLFMEINPVLTGIRSGALNDAGTGFHHEDPEGALGLNVRYGLTSNVTLDGTVNPDFSQVEADAGQIAVNERFALFFPEKRPFFLEGTEIFGLPKQLVFTRTIADPSAGAKLTGKIGGASIGYLGAVDQMDAEDDVFVNLIRLRQDIGSASTLGAIYTDRTQSSEAFNRVAGLDGRFVFSRRYTLQLQGATSWDRDAGAETTTGSLFYAQLARAGRGFTFSTLFEDLSNDFHPESGFIRRLAVAHHQSRIGMSWYGKPGAFVERFAPSVEVQAFWDHDAVWNGERWKEGSVQLQANLSMRDNLSLWVTGTRSEFSSAAEDYDGLFVLGSGGDLQSFLPDDALFGGLHSLRVFLFASGWETLRGRVTAEFKEEPIFDRSRGVPVDIANSWGGEVSLTLLPGRFLSVEASVRHSVLSRKRDGSRYSKATIPRIKAQYQFTRALFVRGIVEYSSQERAALLDPVTGAPIFACDDECDPEDGSDDNDFLLEGLVSYEPSPGTVFFLGYTRRMEDTRAFGFSSLQPTADGLFAKISYLFRL